MDDFRRWIFARMEQIGSGWRDVDLRLLRLIHNGRDRPVGKLSKEAIALA